jgi:hypothetical protein
MIVGFNHNVMYKGEMFHIQTEDSGVKNPHIITLLYRGGNIISSKKTSYLDIVKSDNLEQIVEELMKEQHKDMLRRLKSGEFDARLGLTNTPASPETPAKPAQPKPAPSAPAPPRPAAPAPAPPKAEPAKPAAAAELPLNIQPAAPAKPKQSLDEIIFDFLTSGDDK